MGALPVLGCALWFFYFYQSVSLPRSLTWKFPRTTFPSDPVSKKDGMPTQDPGPLTQPPKRPRRQTLRACLEEMTAQLAEQSGLLAARTEEAENWRRRCQTATAELEAALRQAAEERNGREQAEAANQAKAGILAGLTQEIRSPMNGVIGMADLLLESRLTPDQRHSVEIIRSSARSLVTLIEDILDFSKIETSGVEFKLVDFEPLGILEEIACLLAPVAHTKGLEVTVLIDPRLPDRLRGDPERLRQILSNLVSNAVKFTQRGHVVLSAVLLEPGEAGGGLVRFSVQDTGIGIPKERLARLFDLFGPGGHEKPGRPSGAGLGLALAGRMVHLMGGRIGAESEFGRGSTFWFEIPLSPPLTMKPADPRLSPIAGRRFLVLEPHPPSSQALCLLFERWGAVAVPTGNYAQARLLLRRTSGSTRFSACLFAGEPGSTETAAFLRTVMGHFPDAPPLVLLATSRPLNRTQEIPPNSCVGMVTKPVRSSDLIHCLTQLVTENAAEQAAWSEEALAVEKA